MLFSLVGPSNRVLFSRTAHQLIAVAAVNPFSNDNDTIRGPGSTSSVDSCRLAVLIADVRVHNDLSSVYTRCSRKRNLNPAVRSPITHSSPVRVVRDVARGVSIYDVFDPTYRYTYKRYGNPYVRSCTVKKNISLRKITGCP